MKELVKQDINFYEYPVWFQDQKEAGAGLVWTDRKGFTYRVGYKTPTKTDIIFLYYLMLQSQQAEWKEELTLTQREILRGCGIAPGKKWADRLKDSLERWKMVGIKFTGTFYDGKDYQTMNFGIIDEWDLEKGTGHLNIRFAPKWLEQIKNSNYFRYIDFQQMKSLGSPLAVRLYEILIKSFQGRNEWSINALKLSAKIPMKQKYVAVIIPRITTAVDTINAKTSLNLTLQTKRPKRGQAIFTFRKSKASKPSKPEKTAPPQSCATEITEAQVENCEALIALLPEQHREKNTIHELVAKALDKHGFEYVKQNILYANETAGKSYRVYLTKSILNNWGKEWQEDKNQEDKHKQHRKAAKQVEADKMREEERLHLSVREHIRVMPQEKINQLRSRAYEELTESEKRLDSTILSACVKAKMRSLVAREISDQSNGNNQSFAAGN